MKINKLSTAEIVTLFSIVERKFCVEFVKYDEGIDANEIIDNGLRQIGIESDIPKPPVFGNVIMLPWDIDDESVVTLKKLSFLSMSVTMNMDLQRYVGGLCKDGDPFAYKVGWIGNYLTDDKFRATTVARAISARQEFIYSMFGSWTALDVDKLKTKYQLSDSAAKAAHRLYEYRRGLAMDVGRKTLFDAFNKFTVRYLLGIGLSV